MASPAEHDDQTTEFVFDGVTYLLPLVGNAGKVCAHMQPWLDAETEAELPADQIVAAPVPTK